MSKIKSQGKKTKNNNSLLIITAAVVLCITAGVTFSIRQNKGTDASDVNFDTAAYIGSDITMEKTAAEKTDNGTVQVIAEGESLIIPISSISSTASFYTVEVDGTQMEVLAVADSEGSIRTAFNTCQICYSSGRGYYVQDGNALVCQNCGNRFTVEQVEIQSGGCNPWPIFPENKTVTKDTIEISYDFLHESKAVFANWRMQ